ncbi:MAG: hypothetical protein K2X53_03115 [Alphaproteobacteria bacterium]|nr:hypothetical protein [Alphaproteobacteria bacterium]
MDELRDNILPNYFKRHLAFIQRTPHDATDDKTNLSAVFAALANVYALKSTLLWKLSLKKSVFAFEWQDKDIEECLPDDWKLVRINQDILVYSRGETASSTYPSASSSTEVPLDSVDLKHMSLTFCLVSYYYNSLALQRASDVLETSLLLEKDELAKIIQERALTPFGSWTLSSHYARIPLPLESSHPLRARGPIIQNEVKRFVQQYESLNVDAESIEDFLGELNFEVTNGIIFRATPEYGHHDFSRLELDTLFDQYRDLRQYWNERLAQKESAERASPRADLIFTERKIREIEAAQEQREQESAAKALYQAFGFAFMTSDFLEMPIVYEKKLEAFMDASKALHRDATLRTLQRIHTFFTRHQTLFINTFKERFEFFLMHFALLGAKKKTFPLPPYFHLVAKNYFLATPEYFDRAATHLNQIIVQLESPPLVAISPTTNEQEPRHRKKSVFSGITSVFSKLTLSSPPELSEESSTQVISVTNPIFALHKKTDRPVKGPTTPLPSSFASSSSPSFNNEANQNARSLDIPDGFDSAKRRSSVPELCLKSLLLQKGSKNTEPLLPRGEITRTEGPIGASPKKISAPSSSPASPRQAIDFSQESPRKSTDSDLSSPTSPRSNAEKSETPIKKLFRFNSFTRYNASKSKDSASPPVAKHPLTPRETSSRDRIVDSRVTKDATVSFEQRKSQDILDGDLEKPPSTAPITPEPSAHST